MSRYGTVVDCTNLKTAFVESSDPDDLRQKLNALIANIAAMDVLQLIADITLAGAGDGFTFVVVVDYAPLTAMDGGLVPQSLFAITYMAATQSELAAKRAQIPTLNTGLIDDQMAGASQGTRFMGLMIAGPQGSIDANSAIGYMGFDGGGVAQLSIANTSVLVPILDALMVLQSGNDRFDRPSAGVLRYIGALPILARVSATVSCATPAAVAALHAMRVAIVGAPATTPTQIGLATRFGVPFGSNPFADGVSATVEAPAFLSQNDTLGIAMVDDTGALTGGNSLEIISAQILAIEI